MRQEVAGDWNELHNEELRSELLFTKYYHMKLGKLDGWECVVYTCVVIV
jgi:hypothetical protein